MNDMFNRKEFEVLIRQRLLNTKETIPYRNHLDDDNKVSVKSDKPHTKQEKTPIKSDKTHTKQEKIRQKADGLTPFKTQVEKYGGVGFQSEELARKSRETTKHRYNTDNSGNIMTSTYGVEKLRQTHMERYGVDWNTKRKEIRDKISLSSKGKQSKLKSRTYEEIYGIDKAKQLKETKRDLHLKKFLPQLITLLNHFDVELVGGRYLGAKISHLFRCNRCNLEFRQQWNKIQQGYLCPACHPRQQGYSNGEKEIYNFVKSIIKEGVEVIENTRSIIGPKELDIYIPSLNLAIEYHGLYFHSYEFNVNNDKRHLEKYNLCNRKGIRLIQVFEDEWLTKRDIVKNRLVNKIGLSNVKTHSIRRIHGRDCTIREIDGGVKNEFLSKYHIQGSDTSSIKLGAFHDDILIAVMTFSVGNIAKGVRRRKSGIYELNRFCTNYDYHIPGIASKLLSYFKNNYKWNQIYSYCDLRWSTGNMYYKLGFECCGNPTINYWYIKGLKRYHRFSLRKKPNEPKDMPEWMLRSKEGYSRIWDSGNLKFIMTNKNWRGSYDH